MKNCKRALFLFCMVMVIIPGTFAGCVSRSTPIVSVITSLESRESGSPEYEYYDVLENGKVRKTEAFSPDRVVRLDALHENFSSKIAGNSVVNELHGTVITDQNGNTVPADDTLTDILNAAAGTIRHDMMQFDILKDGDNYFTVVKLNVNWQSPCELYRYDCTAATLEKLYSWDSVDVAGIALP